MIKKLDLIERTFLRENSLYLACIETHGFFTSKDHKRYTLWTCEALSFLLDNIFIRFGANTNKFLVYLVSVLLRKRLYAVHFARKLGQYFEAFNVSIFG